MPILKGITSKLSVKQHKDKEDISKKRQIMLETIESSDSDLKGTSVWGVTLWINSGPFEYSNSINGTLRVSG